MKIFTIWVVLISAMAAVHVYTHRANRASLSEELEGNGGKLDPQAAVPVTNGEAAHAPSIQQAAPSIHQAAHQLATEKVAPPTARQNLYMEALQSLPPMKKEAPEAWKSGSFEIKRDPRLPDLVILQRNDEAVYAPATEIAMDTCPGDSQQAQGYGCVRFPNGQRVEASPQLRAALPHLPPAMNPGGSYPPTAPPASPRP